MKGVGFADLRDAGDPVELARRYELEGADELVVLDVSATAEARRACLDTVAQLRRVLRIPLTVGGGVGCVEDALALLRAGADRVSVNSAAVVRPGLLTELADRVGRQCVVLAVDAARCGGSASTGWEVVTRGGTARTGIDAVAWSVRGEGLGAGEVLLTSVDRDGSMAGYDLDLIRAVSRGVSVPVVASGGARSAEHLMAAFDAGAEAVLAASIFHDGLVGVTVLKNQLAVLGALVRREPHREGETR